MKKQNKNDAEKLREIADIARKLADLSKCAGDAHDERRYNLLADAAGYMAECDANGLDTETKMLRVINLIKKNI